METHPDERRRFRKCVAPELQELTDGLRLLLNGLELLMLWVPTRSIFLGMPTFSPVWSGTHSFTTTGCSLMWLISTSPSSAS